MATSKTSSDPSQFTFWPEDSPVNPTLQQDSRAETPTLAPCGQRCSASSARRGPAGSWQRMFEEQLGCALTGSLATWREKATPSGRPLFQLQPSAPSTSESDSGLLLATPLGCDGKNQSGTRPNKTGGQPLSALVRMVRLLTVKAQDAHGGWSTTPGYGMSLNGVVKNLSLPTPLAFEGRRGPMKAKKHTSFELSKLLRHLRRKDGTPSTYQEAQVELLRLLVADGLGHMLNPDFTEWMMGIPIGWSRAESRVRFACRLLVGRRGLQPSATRSCRRLPMRSSRQSRE